MVKKFLNFCIIQITLHTLSTENVYALKINVSVSFCFVPLIPVADKWKTNSVHIETDIFFFYDSLITFFLFDPWLHEFNAIRQFNIAYEKHVDLLEAVAAREFSS